jgi:hypothetical protein
MSQTCLKVFTARYAAPGDAGFLNPNFHFGHGRVFNVWRGAALRAVKAEFLDYGKKNISLRSGLHRTAVQSRTFKPSCDPGCEGFWGFTVAGLQF